MLLKKILNFLFGSGKRKNGKCKLWNHEFGPDVRHEFMSNTGQYIDGKPVQRKKYYYESTCKNCGATFESDIRTDFF